MGAKLSEINATVVTRTKEVLEGIAETGGLSIGEVIDRMVTTMSPDNVDDASLLILDNILITTKRLTQEQFNETILKVLKVMESSLNKDKRGEVVSKLKDIIDEISK